MFFNSRSQFSFLILSYALLTCLPLFPLLHGRPIEHPWFFLTCALFSWLSLWSMFKRPAIFHYLLLPAFIALPIEVYLQTYFGQGISTHHLGIIFETTPNEALEFLGNKIWLLILLAICIFYWWWILLRIAKQSSCLNWQHQSRWWVLFCLLIVLAGWGHGQLYGVGVTTITTKTEVTSNNFWQWQTWHEQLEQGPKLPEATKIFQQRTSLSQSWPLGIVLLSVDFLQERHYLSKLNEKNHHFLFHAKQETNSNNAQTYIVVLGESSRFDRWSINGYQRETNPWLMKEANLISLQDVITSVSATRLSVPVILSRKPATQSLIAGFAEKSFISAFKEAGFKTFWLSNQMSLGEFDTPTSVFAKEADVTQFLNMGGFTNRSNLDDVLLEPLEQALADSHKKKLIVLHTLGNHWNYSHRYPKSYDRWQPSLFGIHNPAYTDLRNKERISNSYDNSILYTDWILSQFIASLKRQSHPTALWYISDHGQTLYDGACTLAFHGHNTQFEFHIPAFFWYSDQYEQSHSRQVAQIKQHQQSKLSTENVFHSLLDMANIRYPDERLHYSVFHTALKDHIRYVDSYGWSNYDNSTIQGECREVIDNKTPLPQEK
jgi:glucan phosphoethanolaminetransferase (alkaline phosphatase superfamily)